MGERLLRNGCLYVRSWDLPIFYVNKFGAFSKGWGEEGTVISPPATWNSPIVRWLLRLCTAMKIFELTVVLMVSVRS